MNMFVLYVQSLCFSFFCLWLTKEREATKIAHFSDHMEILASGIDSSHLY